MPSLAFNTLSPILDTLPEKIRIQILNIYKHQKILNIETPKTFNEKVNWRKINDRKKIFNIFADKIAVKNHIEKKETGVIVPKILWSGESFRDLNLTELPQKFVLKSNHASGTNLIVNKPPPPQLKSLLQLEKEWKKIDISKTFVEWAYKNIKFQVFAEEYIDFDNEPPNDYKFFVFNGRVELIQMDIDRFKGHKRSFFDRNWKELPFMLTYEKIPSPPPCPKNIKDMIFIAETISENLDFIRVDLYSNGQNTYFGECTLYPGGGFEKFFPVEYDLKLGKLWKIKK